MFEMTYYSICFWFYTSLIIKTFHPLLKILKSKYSLFFVIALVHILLQCFITVNGSGRFTCNKLASRHVRVGLANPSAFPRCDICENAPAFFYCEVDGSSLCLQCDMIVHVGGKRTHGRYLLLRQKVEFPGYRPGHIEEPASQPVDQGETRMVQNHPPKLTVVENQQNHSVSPVPASDANADGHAKNKKDTKMIDLNINPQRMHEHGSNNQDQ